MTKQRCILWKAERMKTLYDLKCHQPNLGRVSDSENKNTTTFLLLNSNCALHRKARRMQVQALKIYCHEKWHSVLFSVWQKKSIIMSDHSISEHNAWVGWDTGESQHKDFVRTEIAQQNCSISQDAHRNLHIFHKNKHYWIFSQDRQIVKIFLAVFSWYFKWMLWLCYTGVVLSVTKISVTNRQWKWSSNHNSFSLSEPKYLAHMIIELRHCTVFQVLQENYAVDIL